MTEFQHPLRLAVGSHKAGSGAGCAMNVISYENGDTTITDFPECSARPLARLVQVVNDLICTHTTKSGTVSLLCPECSRIVLDLGHATVGTAAACTRRQMTAWLRSLLVDPGHGVVRYADKRGQAAIRRVAGLLAAEREVTAAEWEDARNAAFAAAATAVDEGWLADSEAAYAAADAADAAAYAAAHAANVAADANVANAAVYANAAADVYAARVDHARWVIAEWHRIAGTQPADIPADAVAEAVQRMHAVAGRGLAR